MKTIIGLPASPGIASGPACVMVRGFLHVDRHPATEVQRELARLESALDQVDTELDSLTRHASEAVGEKEAGIFKAQQSILRDPELKIRTTDMVKNEQVTIEFAWQEAIRYFSEALRRLDNEYLAIRAVDVDDVGQRVLSVLLNRSERQINLDKPSIVVAEDLAPSDTLVLDRDKVLAFCTRRGGPTSHVVILSKALGIPCIVGLGEGLDEVDDGDFLIVDGHLGKLLLDPDPDTIRDYELMATHDRSQLEDAERIAGLPAVTLDGQHVEVVANVGSLKDANEALIKGAEGIGLLRTEFLFLDRTKAPDQDEQISQYSEIFKVMGNSKPLVVRTLDIGGDKPVSYLNIQPEKNPFLGIRGIRLSLLNQKMFEDQLCALLIAGTGYDLRIMFPMVASLEELSQAQMILDKCRRELISKGRPICERYQVGIMVEVPSAAIMAHAFSKNVDFFSIGTNDLSQYTLAAERTSAEVAYLADPFHPAILELIRRVVEAAHEQKKWVGLCGEFAGDPLAAPLLLGLGLDELSASPKLIPRMKQTIRTLNQQDCNFLAQEALRLTSAKAVREYLHRNKIQI